MRTEKRVHLDNKPRPTLHVAVLSALCCLPVLAQAQELRPTYNEVFIGYGRLSGGVKYQQLFVRSELGQNAFVFGQVDRIRSADYSEYKGRDVKVGGGYHTPIADRTDFVVDGAFARQREEWANSHSDSMNSYVVSVGVKHRVNRVLQLRPSVGFSYTSSGAYLPAYRTPTADLEWSADFTPHWGLSGMTRIAKGGEWNWSAGARYTW